MKKILTLIVLLTALATAQAGPVSKQQARQSAQAWMAAHGRQISAEPARRFSTGNGQEQPSLYVFNSEGDHGFVVISADDRTEAVLGYVEQGTYGSDPLPEGLTEWMDAMSEAIKGLSASSDAAAPRPRYVSSHAAIRPLIQTRWNQGTASATGFVYNTLCPTYGGRYCLTGCVATATAQLMYYYQWPKTPTTTIPSYVSNSALGTLDALPPVVFNWADMQPTYSGNETTAQIDAVAQLMRYCGQNAKMNY